MNEIKPVRNINTCPESFLDRSPLQKEVHILHINCKTMHMSNVIFPDYRKITLTKTLQQSLEPSTFVSHRAWMSGEFDSRKDSDLIKFERRPQILVKLSFRELCDSKLLDSGAFDNMTCSLSQKKVVKIGKVNCKFVRHRSLNFCDPHWVICCIKTHGTLKY